MPVTTPSVSRIEPAKPEAPEPVAARIDQRIANGVLSQFSDAYAAGDLRSLRAMFSSSPAAVDRTEWTMSEYKRLFASSHRRSLAVHNVNFFRDGEVVTIVASYEASVTADPAGKPRRFRGDIRLDVQHEQGRWLILRLQQNERPG
jgi:hypothetical protein